MMRVTRIYLVVIRLNSSFCCHFTWLCCTLSSFHVEYYSRQAESIIIEHSVILVIFVFLYMTVNSIIIITLFLKMDFIWMIFTLKCLTWHFTAGKLKGPLLKCICNYCFKKYYLINFSWCFASKVYFLEN